MLSAAKHLVADRDRPFASLRVTIYDYSNCQELCFIVEPCLSIIDQSKFFVRLGKRFSFVFGLLGNRRTHITNHW